MHGMYVLLNPGIYSDPRVALVVIEIYGVGNGIVRQCNSWDKLSELAVEFNGSLSTMPWPEPSILDWCIANWGPDPF